MGKASKASAAATFALGLFAGTSMAAAADVTFERLRHPEPHNWLMNHGDYNAHRFSALDKINKGNVRNLATRISWRRHWSTTGSCT